MIMQVPETILGTAVATAMLPTLAEVAARKEWAAFRTTIEKAARVFIVLTLPIAAVLAVAIEPLVQAVFGLQPETSALLSWTARAYLLTLTGFSLQEVAARAFYARKEPYYPLFGVLLRLALFLGIGAAGVMWFRDVGAPILALAEIALLVESIVLFMWLGHRLQDGLHVWGAVRNGMVAALCGGGVTLAVMSFAPLPAWPAALLGLGGGSLVALALVRKEAALLLRL
jgi:putative peptidoglycan lipid II flippase